MFEKEAFNYGMIYAKTTLLNTNKELEQAYKDGAEFGYNKANEWHYPSKGEYPKDEKNVLMSEQLILLTKLKGTNNLSISIGQYNFSTQEFSYPHIVGVTDVYAWKEIVLPELKESE